jgi:sugar O-acyltransferase (sialic acid O-acetyltransferase NeuD family)
MEQILLLGGGGHCKSVIDVIEAEGRFKIAGIIDKPSRLGESVAGYKVIGSDEDLVELKKMYSYALVTVGQIKTASVRISLFQKLQSLGFVLPSVISPRAYVSRTASIDEGSVIMHDVLLNTHVSIGKNCIINTKVLVEHDTKVGDHCHISTGVVLNGNVVVENKTFVGSGSITREGIKVSKGSFIKAGSLIK